MTLPNGGIPADFKYTPSPELSPQARMVMNKVMEWGDNYVHNILFSRDAFMRHKADKRRDIAAECGWPPTGEITIDIYRDTFERNPIAARVVEVYPRECWQVHPEVYETEDIETTTAFEKAWNELGKSFVSEETDYFQDQQGSVIWNQLKLADELSGIGRYGVLLLGLADGQKDLSKPVQFKKHPSTSPPSSPASPSTPAFSSNARAPRLAYLRAYPEYLADVVELESDSTSPRYGQPKMYVITVTDPRNVAMSTTMTGAPTQTMMVHWTRVIHIADTYHTASSSEWFAVPRMRPVFNNLNDLSKLYGGSAEMYWLGAFPGLAFKAIAEEGMAPAVNDPMLKSEIENYMHGLQRFLRLVNIDVEPLSPQVVDPSPQIATQLEAICVKIGMPKRIFMGSERGELASSQDDATWNDRKRDRQNGYITTRIIRPFVNRLIALGILPAPKGYSVAWPDLSNQTAAEKADVAFKRSQALSQYADSQAAVVITPTDFLVKIVGMEEEEAKKVTENAKEEAAKAQEEMQKQQEKALADQQAQDQQQAQQGEADKQSWLQGLAGVKKPPTAAGKAGAKGSPPGKPAAPASPLAPAQPQPQPMIPTGGRR